MPTPSELASTLMDVHGCEPLLHIAKDMDDRPAIKALHDIDRRWKRGASAEAQLAAARSRMVFAGRAPCTPTRVMRSSITRIAPALATAALVVSCAGGRQTTLQPSPRTPAAEGKVEAKEGENGNTRVSVQVEHLAPPQDVASGASTYVVWAQPIAGDSQPRNIGALSVDQDRKGELQTLTPLKSFDVIVTPEPNAKVQRPSGEPVLKARVSSTR